MPTKKIEGINRRDLFYVEPRFIRVEPGFNARITAADDGVAVDDDLSDLDSILEERGILVPLLVRPDDTKVAKYVVVEGHRRFKRAKKAWADGHDVMIPIIVEYDLNEQDATVMMAMAGLQRRDFTFAEEAKLVNKFVRGWGWPVVKTANKLGRKVEWVQQRLTITAAPSTVLSAVASGAMPADVAAKIAHLTDEAIAEVVAASRKGRGCARRAAEGVTGKAARPGKKVVVSMIQVLAETKKNRTARTNRWIENCLGFANGTITADDLAAMLRR